MVLQYNTKDNLYATGIIIPDNIKERKNVELYWAMELLRRIPDNTICEYNMDCDIAQFFEIGKYYNINPSNILELLNKYTTMIVDDKDYRRLYLNLSVFRRGRNIAFKKLTITQDIYSYSSLGFDSFGNYRYVRYYTLNKLVKHDMLDDDEIINEEPTENQDENW